MKKTSNYFLGLQAYFYALLVAFIVIGIFSCKRKTIITPNQTYYVLNLVLPSSDSGTVVAYRDSEHTTLLTENDLDSLKLGDKLYLKATPAVGCIVVRWNGVDEGSESADKNTAVITIDVTNEPVSVVFGIDGNVIINKTSIDIELGLTDTLSATFSPNNISNLSMSWSSLNPAIATIDENGIITAKGEGTTKIIATPSINGIKPDTCMVNIVLWDGNKLTPVDIVGNTYFISAASQLAWIASENNRGISFAGKKVLLNNDINLNNKLWTPIGGSSQTLSLHFLGDLEGNHKTIKNLYIDYNGSGGLFTYIGDEDNGIVSTIQNIVLENVNVTAVRNVGSLVGHVRNGVLKNCQIVYGTVTTKSTTGNNVGGLVGEIDEGRIENCTSGATVRVQAGVKQTNGAGGLVGWNYNASIIGCSSTGNVIGDGYYVGGLIGLNDGIITACKSSASVEGAYGARAGGLVGINGGDIPTPIVSSSYAIGNISGDITYGGGLIGRNYPNGTITNCYATGIVTSTSATPTLGSIVGYNMGNVNFSISTTTIIVIGKNTGTTNQVTNNATNVFVDMTNTNNVSTALYNGNNIPIISLWKNEYWNTNNQSPKLIWE